MRAACQFWKGLEHEKSRFSDDIPRSSRHFVTWRVLLCFLGGYIEPRWWRDRRPQPLRSRCVVQRFRTLLRREAVIRLRLEGRSFREIGQELGISHVAVWKLWQQTQDDQIQQCESEILGQAIWSHAQSDAARGNIAAKTEIFDRVAGTFGVRIARRFLGRMR